MPPPLAAYFRELRNHNVDYSSDVIPKLVIPSIKRDLIFRDQQKVLHARPFLKPFMAYLTQSGDEGETKDFMVFLWSKAMKKTLRPMMDKYLMEWKNDVLGECSRENLGLKEESYVGNPDTFKDLDKLFKHLQATDIMNMRKTILQGDFVATIGNTVLLEEKASKCRLQPFNFIPLPEYSDKEYQDSVIALEGELRQAKLDNAGEAPTKELAEDEKLEQRAELWYKIFGTDAATFYDRSMSVGTPDQPVCRLDAYLVALVGIMSDLRNVVNVPVWIAAGGLKPDIAHTFTKAIAGGGWDHVARIDQGLIDVPVPRLELKNHEMPSALPLNSREEWFQSPLHVLYWVRRGLCALDARGIQLDHGVERK